MLPTGPRILDACTYWRIMPPTFRLLQNLDICAPPMSSPIFANSSLLHCSRRSTWLPITARSCLSTPMISRQKVAVGEGIHIAGGTWVGGETLYQCNKISFPAQEPDICMFLLLLPWAWSHKTLHDPAVLSVACQKQEISSHPLSRCCRRWLTRILPTSSSAAS